MQKLTKKSRTAHTILKFTVQGGLNFHEKMLGPTEGLRNFSLGETKNELSFGYKQFSSQCPSLHLRMNTSHCSICPVFPMALIHVGTATVVESTLILTPLLEGECNRKPL